MTLRRPLWIQDDTVTYSAQLDRGLISAAFSTGTCGSADLKVAQRGAGANMTVDVAAGTVIVAGSAGAYVCASDAVTNLSIGAAPGSGTRIDLIVATVRDSQASGTGTTYDWILQPVAGTASGTPSPPSTPANSTVLARVTVATGTASITTAQIADYRLPATPPAGLWTTLPTQGRAGQVIGTADGKGWVYNAGWKELTNSSTLQIASAVTYSTVNDTTTSFNVSSGGPVSPALPEVTLAGTATNRLIEATFIGSMACSIGTSGADIHYTIQVSLDNGTTWNVGPSRVAYAANTSNSVGLFDYIQRTATTSSTVKARVVIQHYGGSPVVSNISLLLKSTPVA